MAVAPGVEDGVPPADDDHGSGVEALADAGLDGVSTMVKVCAAAGTAAGSCGHRMSAAYTRAARTAAGMARSNADAPADGGTRRAPGRWAADRAPATVRRSRSVRAPVRVAGNITSLVSAEWGRPMA